MHRCLENSRPYDLHGTILCEGKQRWPFTLAAMVLLPDHPHAVERSRKIGLHIHWRFPQRPLLDFPGKLPRIVVAELLSIPQIIG